MQELQATEISINPTNVVEIATKLLAMSGHWFKSESQTDLINGRRYLQEALHHYLYPSFDNIGMQKKFFIEKAEHNLLDLMQCTLYMTQFLTPKARGELRKLYVGPMYY